METRSRKEILWHLIFGALWVGFFYHPIWILLRTTLDRSTYSHILAIPFITAFLLFQKKTDIFRESTETGSTARLGTIFSLLGVLSLLGGTTYRATLSTNDWLALAIFSAISTLFGYLLIVKKRIDLKASAFPGLFTFLAVPIPDFILTRTVQFLVWGSSHVTELLFRVVGIVYYREGAFFSLPGFEIEIAKECSGIRTSISLLISILLAGHFFLKRPWSKTVLVLSVLPLVLVKNGIRITTLTWLALHVDRTWLTDSILHHSGGVVFFAITLLLVFLELVLLRKLERRGGAVITKG